MVARIFRRQTGFRKTALLLAALFVILSLTNCQFLGSDMFPTTLSRAEAVLDLDSELADLGMTGDFEVRKMQFATSPTTGKSFVLLLADSIGTGPRLLILDAEDLSVINSSTDPAVAYVVGMDDRGYLITSIGTSNANVYDPATLFSLGTISLGQTITTDAYSGTGSDDMIILWYEPSSGNLAYNQISAGAASGNWYLPLSMPFISNAQLVSVYYEGSAVKFLLSDNFNRLSHIVTYSGSAMLGSTGSPIMSNAAVATIPSGDDRSGWLTRNGAIILSHDNETRLVRYDSDTGEELDSFSMNDTEDARFNFSPDGKKWLMYDGVHGKLHLLRTWW